VLLQSFSPGSELRQRRDQLVDGVGGFLELGFFVGGEVELDDLFHAFAAEEGRDSDEEILEAVFAVQVDGAVADRVFSVAFAPCHHLLFARLFTNDGPEIIEADETPADADLFVHGVATNLEVAPSAPAPDFFDLGPGDRDELTLDAPEVDAVLREMDLLYEMHLLSGEEDTSGTEERNGCCHADSALRRGGRLREKKVDSGQKEPDVEEERKSGADSGGEQVAIRLLERFFHHIPFRADGMGATRRMQI
jgi:hypothetical protein